MEPAGGGGAVLVVDAALHREQVDPAMVIRMGEEHDPLGQAAGVPEPVAVEHRVVHEDTPGSVPGQADMQFEMRWTEGDLLHDAAHPPLLTGQHDLACVSRVDTRSVAARIRQFGACDRGVLERGVGDPVSVGQARVLGEEERERVRPALDPVGIGPVAGLVEYRACLIRGQVDPEIGLHAFTLEHRCGSRLPVRFRRFIVFYWIVIDRRRGGLGRRLPRTGLAYLHPAAVHVIIGPELIRRADQAPPWCAKPLPFLRDDERLDGLAHRRQGDLGIGSAGGAGMGQPGGIVPGLLA